MNTQLGAVFAAYEGRRDELIPILQDVQAAFGCLSEEAMLEIARFTGISESQLYAVATFYAQFRFTPIGRNHVMVCRGTACHVRGATRILEEIQRHLGIGEGETSEDLEYTLETVACIGACGLAPVVKVGTEVQGRLQPSEVLKILKGH